MWVHSTTFLVHVPTCGSTRHGYSCIVCFVYWETRYVPALVRLQCGRLVLLYHVLDLLHLHGQPVDKLRVEDSRDHSLQVEAARALEGVAKDVLTALSKSDKYRDAVMMFQRDVASV